MEQKLNWYIHWVLGIYLGCKLGLSSSDSSHLVQSIQRVRQRCRSRGSEARECCQLRSKEKSLYYHSLLALAVYTSVFKALTFLLAKYLCVVLPQSRLPQFLAPLQQAVERLCAFIIDILLAMLKYRHFPQP